MPYETFMTNIANALQLINVAKIVEDPNSKQLLYRSTIVLSVAHWQYFNEELVRQYSKLIQNRATSSKNIPEIVRTEIGKWLIPKEVTSNQTEKYRKLIWEYAGGKWKKDYGEFAEEKIRKLNTPNSKILVDLYRSVLGIENISGAWSAEILSYNPSKALDIILMKRHEIAHGNFSDILSENDLEGYLNALKEIAKVSYSVASDETAKILEKCGPHYTLDSYDLKGLIKWLADLKEPKIFKVRDLSSINGTWHSNQNKLSYAAWDLLQGPTNQRIPTDKFMRFIAGEIAIPYEIVSFRGVDSIAKQGTAMLYFKDL